MAPSRPRQAPPVWRASHMRLRAFGMPAAHYHQRRQRLWRHLLWYISLNNSTSIRFCKPLFPWGGGGGGPQPGLGGGGGGPQPGLGGLPCVTKLPSNGSSSACISSSSLSFAAYCPGSYCSCSYCSASYGLASNP